MRGLSRGRVVPLLCALLQLATVSLAHAQEAAPEAAQQPLFKPEEIDQIVAPIALYPDPLVAQILMASTYPVEIVMAERWTKANPDLQGKALEDALQGQPWDPSVKSLVVLPQVLTMMSEKLDWTQKLGDAFLAQQADVMNGVQRLRAKAQAEGHLQSNEQQKVVVQQVPETQTTVIQIQPANPQVVYVPTYNPTVVYGAWPYPAYPPYYYYPPGYVATTAFVSFGVGMAMGAAMWGDCNWGHGDVDVNVKHYNEFNRTDIKNGNWQHNPEHRRGAGYRDPKTQQRYARQTPGSAQTREQFRGRAEQGRRDLGGGGAGGAGVADRGRGTGAPSAADRGLGTGAPSAADRSRGAGGPGVSDRGRGSDAFQGVGNGAQARRDSSRGNASRASSSSWGSRGGGGGRAGGGMSRGGGRGGRR